VRNHLSAIDVHYREGMHGRGPLVAVLGALLLGSCTPDGAAPRTSRVDEPIHDDGLTAAGSPERSCKAWLRGVLLEIGEPEGRPLEPPMVKHALGLSTLRLDPPGYTGRFDVFVFAEEPDLLNVDIETIPIIARRDGFVLRFTHVKGPTQQFVTATDEVWITMHVVPEGDTMSLRRVRDHWFQALVKAVKRTPPPDPCADV
jgi:hypothetical protein